MSTDLFISNAAGRVPNFPLENLTQVSTNAQEPLQNINQIFNSTTQAAFEFPGYLNSLLTMIGSEAPKTGNDLELMISLLANAAGDLNVSIQQSGDTTAGNYFEQTGNYIKNLQNIIQGEVKLSTEQITTLQSMIKEDINQANQQNPKPTKLIASLNALFSQTLTIQSALQSFPHVDMSKVQAACSNISTELAQAQEEGLKSIGQLDEAFGFEENNLQELEKALSDFTSGYQSSIYQVMVQLSQTMTSFNSQQTSSSTMWNKAIGRIINNFIKSSEVVATSFSEKLQSSVNRLRKDVAQDQLNAGNDLFNV